MFETLLHSWSHGHGAWLASVGFTLAIYVAAALAIPFAVARVPADYFAHPSPPPRATMRLLRIIAGALITALGVALLFLPGPGIVTILLGLAIVGGPVAERGVRRLAARPRVLAAINEIRRKRGRPPLIPPDDDPHDST